MNTLPIIDAVVLRLRKKLPALQVEYFPEKPADYHLTHPHGAVLVNYVSSTFGSVEDLGTVLQPQAHPLGSLLLSHANPKFAVMDDLGAVLQPQTIMLSATIVLQQLNGRYGAVDILDAVRQALGGFVPPNCCRRIWLVRDQFLGEVGGFWQYVIDFSTESLFIEDCDSADEPLLTTVNYEEA